MVTYYMKWETRKLSGRTAAYQVIVWRHEDTSEARGIAQDVFWDILFADHDVVCTDRQQSSLGRRFWKYQLDTAFKEGYPVYLLDLMENTKTRVNNSSEVNALSDKIWAPRRIGQAWLLCVAKSPFWG